jgi:hypothetical protein
LVSGWATSTVRQQIPWHALATFGATIRRHPFLSVAAGCRISLSKSISLLAVACCFCVLHAQWCQEWCQMAPAAPRVSMSLTASKTSPGPPCGPLRSTPILVKLCGYSVCANVRTLGAGESSVSVPDIPNKEDIPGKIARTIQETILYLPGKWGR